MTLMKTSDLIRTCMKKIRCNRIYTLPADLSLQLLEELENSGMELINVPNEEAMVTAADVEAQLIGYSAVVCTDGYSVTKLINGLIAAKLRYSSLLVIVVGHENTEGKSSLLNQYPQPTRLQIMMSSIGINCISAGALSDPQAFYMACNEPKRMNQPVVLTVTNNEIKELKWSLVEPLDPTTSETQDINKAVAEEKLISLLEKNPKMLLIFGNGINKHRSKLYKMEISKEIVQKYLILPSAKGCLNEEDIRSIGTYQGDFSSEIVKKLLHKVHSVLLIEVEDHEICPGLWKPFTAEKNWTLRNELKKQGKKIYNLSEQEGLSGEGGYVRPINWIATMFTQIDSSKNKRMKDKSREIQIGDESCYYNQVMVELNKKKCKKTIITDVGISCLTMYDIMVKKDVIFIGNTVWANMGFCFAAGIAAAKAWPEQELWLISGDGSAVMTMQDLLMYVQQSIPVNVVILDNKGYLTEKIKNKGEFNKGFRVDWCAYAEAIGFDYTAKVDCEKPLMPALEALEKANKKYSLLWINIPETKLPRKFIEQIPWQNLKNRNRNR